MSIPTYGYEESHITMRILGICTTIGICALFAWSALNNASHRKCIETAFTMKVTDMDLVKRVCQ